VIGRRPLVAGVLFSPLVLLCRTAWLIVFFFVLDFFCLFLLFFTFFFFLFCFSFFLQNLLDR